MKKVLAVLGFIVFSSAVLAADSNYEISDLESDYIEINELDVGHTTEVLFMMEGDATIVEERVMRGMLFINYYYEQKNMSYLVNPETGNICDISEGKNRGSCFPCEEGEVSALCP